MFTLNARSLRFVDVIFLLLLTVYVLAAFWGVLSISAEGADMDSDLRCYAQNMAGQQLRAFFGADPLLHAVTPANNFWNLETFAAALLTPENNYALGLLRAGALCFFAYYVFFYLLGRFLFESPSLACLLSILMGITVWFNFGTFWGIGFSDPTPRVFYAALWPLLLMGTLGALDKPRLRPFIMLACGICVYVHAISALCFGGMVFTAFLLRRPDKTPLRTHLAQAGLGLGLFFIPVLIFLWPSLGQEKIFTPDELAVFQEIFATRFREDHGDLVMRLGSHVHLESDTLPLLCGGLAGWGITWLYGGTKTKKLASIYPGFLLGMALIFLFSWLEPKAALLWGRLSMGQEFVRGVRFLAPLSWLMIISAAACLWPLLHGSLRVFITSTVIVVILTLNPGRWQMGAFHTLSQYVALPQKLQKTILETRTQAESYRQALLALSRLVPPGESVFGINDDMAVRYLALRPLTWAFKDGSSFLYNKDLQGARNWLRMTALVEQNQKSYVEAWRSSGANWLLTDRRQDRDLLEQQGKIVWEEQGWLIVHHRGMP